MRRLPRHLILWPALACAAVALVAVVAFAVAWLTAPSITDLQARVRALDEASGAHPVSLHRVAPVMREATVATEDERFYSHDGIDVIGVLRALPYDVSHLSLAEGASTITEQLAKLVYLGGNDHSPWGKLRDAAIALRIEAAYPKERILADYLNSVYLGAGAYGVQAASERYFSIPASRLDLSQATLLAGLIQDPSGDQPYANPLDARQRQAEALTSMVRNGFATEAEVRRALAKPLPLAHGRPLRAAPGLDIVPAPPFYWGELVLGLVMLAVGVGGLLALRRVRPRLAAALAIASTSASWLMLAGGAVVVLGSFRGV
jgi:membrane peptidoglycan carboxypeptidase